MQQVGISEAARLLGVTPSTVIRWANIEKIAVEYTAGGQRRIPMCEIERIKSTTKDRVERNRQQTQAARDALAAKRGQSEIKAYTGADMDSFVGIDVVEEVDEMKREQERLALAALFQREE